MVNDSPESGGPGKEAAIQDYIDFQFKKVMQTPTYQRVMFDLIAYGNATYTDEDIKQMLKEAE